MGLEQRVEQIEVELRTLKLDIQKTLVDIRDAIPAKPSTHERWQKKAWMLALVNMVLAIVLFTNLHLYLPTPAPLQSNPAVTGWLRALWLAIALIWLLLQLYPLALLLEQEDPEWRGVAWRNALAFVRARPGFMVVLTFVVLIVAIINAAIPAAWLVVLLAALIGFGSFALRNVLELWRGQFQPHRRG